jgi:16S rRNA (guanine966-N2)-methyltransferase
MAVEAFIAQARDEPYAIIVMDPPYASATIETTLNAVAHSRLVRDGTIVVLGHWPRLTPKEQYGHLTQLTSRRLGDSSFTIFENINEDVTKDE